MRCFVALGLEESPDATLARWLEGTRALFPELAVSPAGNLHLTLVFLGEVGEGHSDVAGAAVRLAAGGRPAWSLRWTYAGAFPSAARPRVLWLGVDGGEALQDAHRALSQELAASGLAPSQRAFRPHLTLARLRRGQITRQRQQEILAHLQTLPPVAPSRAVSLVLYRSQLGRGPAVHSPLVTARLTG